MKLVDDQVGCGCVGCDYITSDSESIYCKLYKEKKDTDGCSDIDNPFVYINGEKVPQMVHLSNIKVYDNTDSPKEIESINYYPKDYDFSK